MAAFLLPSLPPASPYVLFRPFTSCPVLRTRSNSGRGGGIRTPIPGFGDRSPNRWTTPLKSETGLACFSLQPKLRFGSDPSRQPAALRMPFARATRMSFHFFVRGVLAARPAELLGLHAFGVLLFVFRRCVVAIFAIATLQRDDFPHDSFSLFPEIFSPKPNYSMTSVTA